MFNKKFKISEISFFLAGAITLLTLPFLDISESAIIFWWGARALFVLGLLSFGLALFIFKK